MRGFQPVDGGYEAVLDDMEREVLVRAATDIARMLTPAATGETPQDSAIARLVPDASDDDEVASEFRRLTQDDIAGGKAAGLVRFAELIGQSSGQGTAPCVVMHEDARAVATALTDIRLVLADRLDLASDDEVEALHDELEAAVMQEEHGTEPEDAPDGGVRRFLAGVFVTVGWLQESLVEAMLQELRERR